MENLPDSLYEDPILPPALYTVGVSPFGAPGAISSGAIRFDHEDLSDASIEQLILALINPHRRERALRLLCKRVVDSEKAAETDELAVLLWHSFGTAVILLQEIVMVYPSISSPNLTQKATTRVCNALSLMQCIASHPATRMPFIKANMPLYLLPLLETSNKGKCHEYLRPTALGVIGALVKNSDEEAILYLLKNRIFSYCLHCMEVGNELSKTVATFIVQKVILTEEGIRYCCTIAERFYAIQKALTTMIEQLAEEPSERLLKHILRVYLKFSENPRACVGLRGHLPNSLFDPTCLDLIRDDPVAVGWLMQLYKNVSHGYTPKDEYIGEFQGPPSESGVE